MNPSRRSLFSLLLAPLIPLQSIKLPGNLSVYTPTDEHIINTQAQKIKELQHDLRNTQQMLRVYQVLAEEVPDGYRRCFRSFEENLNEDNIRVITVIKEFVK